MARRARVHIDIAPLRQFRNQVTGQIRGQGGPVTEAMRTKWADRYLLYLRKRFRANAAGGGDWPPLSPVTLARDAEQGVTRSGIILVTKAIFNALFRGRPGNVIARTAKGVRVGIGGNAKHPGTKLTIGRLASIHHNGTTRIPARKVMYPPDATVKAGWVRDAAYALRQLARGLAAATGNASRFFGRR